MFDTDEDVTEIQRLYGAHYEMLRRWIMAAFAVNTTAPAALEYRNVSPDVICQMHLARIGLHMVLGIPEIAAGAGYVMRPCVN